MIMDDMEDEANEREIRRIRQTTRARYYTDHHGAHEFVTQCACGIPSRTGLCEHTEHHDAPAAPERGEWRYREGSGVIYEAKTVPERIIARYVDKDIARQIIAQHNLYEPMLDALKEVEAMLNVELARDYESKSWAKKVRAAITTSEREGRR